MEWSIQEVSQRKEKEKQVEKKKEAPVFPIRGATKATGAVTSASEGHWVRLSVDTLVIKCNICYQFLIRVDSRSQASSSMRTHQQKRRRMTHRPLLSSYVSWTAQCVIVALMWGTAVSEKCASLSRLPVFRLCHLLFYAACETA